MHLNGGNKTMYHFYKINRLPSNLPNYAIRNHSNGVTGYQSKLDEELVRELNIFYLGYMSEEQTKDWVVAQRYGKALSRYESVGGSL